MLFINERSQPEDYSDHKFTNAATHVLMNDTIGLVSWLSGFFDAGAAFHDPMLEKRKSKPTSQETDITKHETL